MGSGTPHNATTKQQPKPVGEQTEEMPSPSPSPIIWWSAWCRVLVLVLVLPQCCGEAVPDRTWLIRSLRRAKMTHGEQDRGFILFYNYLFFVVLRSAQADCLCILHLSWYLFKSLGLLSDSWPMSNTPHILSGIFWSVENKWFTTNSFQFRQTRF